jgi:ribosomal protein S18 acetylase RimI-like enzyme
MLVVMPPDHDLLDRLDSYYDAVPRARSSVEQLGPFTLFVATSGWPYYGRPTRGAQGEASGHDVRRLLARQQELGVPQAIEWVHELAPALAETVESEGVSVLRAPLLVLHGAPRGADGSARMLSGGDVEALVASRASINVAFATGGTDTGKEGIEARDASTDSEYAQVDDFLIERINSGELRQAAVFDPDHPELGAVGGGGYSPVGEVAEIAGVGVLPAYRRRGFAGQLTYVLARDALARGVTTVFCSAQSDDVARVYEGIGFERVGTACIAEAQTPPGRE